MYSLWIRPRSRLTEAYIRLSSSIRFWRVRMVSQLPYCSVTASSVVCTVRNMDCTSASARIELKSRLVGGRK